jgi:hypothetical protein
MRPSEKISQRSSNCGCCDFKRTSGAAKRKVPCSKVFWEVGDLQQKKFLTLTMPSLKKRFRGLMLRWIIFSAKRVLNPLKGHIVIEILPEYSKENTFGLLFWERASFLEHFFKRAAVEVLVDEVNVVGRFEHFDHANDVLVFEFFECLDLVYDLGRRLGDKESYHVTKKCVVEESIELDGLDSDCFLAN